MNRIIAFALIAATSCNTVFAQNVRRDLILEEKRQVDISVGVSLTLPNTSATSQPTSNSPIVTQSTVTVSPTGAPSTTVVTSVSTRPASTTPAVTSESFSQIISSAVQETIITYITTRDGTTEIATSTGETTVPVTTSARVTPTNLAAGQDGGSSGLNDSTKKIIGGVVGGVGGALLIGALAFTAWRIWGKKNKNLHDDNLYDPNMNAEKFSSSTGDNTPFQSTLDQYHRPGPVNTASNF